MQTRKTERGFKIGEFNDMDGKLCSLQESSLATEAAVWFGTQDATPMYKGEPVPFPKDTLFNDRMDLTCHLASMIMRRFEKFLATSMFPVIKNKPDRYGNTFSMFASDDHETLWLGCDDANPQVCNFGWKPVPYPEGTTFDIRMHLNKEIIEDLLPLLKSFIQTGSLRHEV